MPLVADDLGAWLVGLLADAGRRRLTAWVLGSEQDRALRQAAVAALRRAAGELCPQGGACKEELALVVSQVFSDPVPMAARATLLEALQSGVASQLAVLGDAELTGTGVSSAQVLGVTASAVAEVLTGHLVREIMARGSHGGPLEPLAAQLNHDMTHLQGQRLEQVVGQFAGEVRDALARLHSGRAGAALSGVQQALPADTAAFTGRDVELDLIMGTVNAAAGKGGVVTICPVGGMPGVGKTALAVHAAHLLRHQFPDRQLFINLHGHTPGRHPVTPQAALGELLAAAGADTRALPAGLGERAALWRDRMAGHRALLVLDNAASSAQVVPLLPASPSCLVLITSRRHLGDLPGVSAGLVLEILPPDSAREMFYRLAPRAAATAAPEITELVRLAGFLPLAISLLARVYDRHPSWSLADLTAETRASMLTLAAENDSVAAAFEVSYRYLPIGRQEFFRRLGLHPGPAIDVYAAAALAGISAEEATGHLDALHGEALLAEVDHRRYAMHDLIRRYVRHQGTGDPAAAREQALERLLDYYQFTAAIAETRLARHTPVSPAPPAALPLPSAPALDDGNQALVWARAERGNLLTCLDYAAGHGHHARVVALTAAMTSLLQHDGPWSDAITRHASAVQAARRLGDERGEACHLTGLGAARMMTGDYSAAAQNLQEALRISRSLADQRGQAAALNYLGVVRRLTGDYPSAATALGEAQDICRCTGDRLGQASTLNELGALCWLVGDCPAAIRALDQALSMYCELGDRYGLANTLINVGAVRLMTGEYPQATRALEDARGIYHDLADRHGQANALNYLGAVRRLTGDYPGAAQALDQALRIYHDLGDPGGEVMVLNEAGTLNRLRGDIGQAENCHRQALNLARQIASSWDEAHALAGLGRCALAVGQPADAVMNLQHAREIFQRIGAIETDGICAELEALASLA